MRKLLAGLRRVRPYAIGACIMLVVLGSVFIPLNIVQSNRAEAQAVQQSFYSTYGSTPTKILAQGKQTAIWVVAWEKEGTQHLSALIGGVWVEITQSQTSPPPDGGK